MMPRVPLASMRRPLSRLVVSVGMYVITELLLGRGDPKLVTGGVAFLASPSGSPSVLVFMMASFPTVLFCYLFSDFLGRELSVRAGMTLSRVGSRRAWALVMGGEMSCWVLVYVALCSACVLLGDWVALSIAGGTFSFSELTDIVLWSLPLRFVLCAVLMLAINLLALEIDEINSCVVVLGVHFGTLFGASLLPYSVSRAVAPYLPSVRCQYAWNCEELLVGGATNACAHPRLLLSVVMLAALVGMLSIALIRRVQAIDVL